MNFPFSPYDFFGFLAAGFILICATERATDNHWIIDQDLKWTTAAAWVGAAYILGHLVANVSSFFIEHKLVRTVIGCPEDLLFTDEPKAPDRPPLKERARDRRWLGWVNPAAWWRWAFPTGWRRGVFPIYFKPLPKETRERILKKSTKEGFDKPGRALFYHCHTLVKRDKIAFDRMTSFLNIYGFCRNVCMASFAAAAVFTWAAVRDLPAGGGLHADKLWWAGAALAVGVGMVYRYLKFFRHYTSEMFVTYSELADTKSAEPKPS